MSQARHMLPNDLSAALAAMEAQSQLAQWYDGESNAFASHARHVDPASHSPSASANFLSANELAARAGITAARVRQILRREVAWGEPGFRKRGGRWCAEWEAFERVRKSS